MVYILNSGIRRELSIPDVATEKKRFVDKHEPRLHQ